MAERILIIEDEIRIAYWLQAYLKKAEYDAFVATDGPSGLKMAHEAQPDLIILDVLLPGMDGVEVCRRLRLRSAVPILMLTARGEEDDRVLGLNAGADDYVVKPFMARELVARVQALLRRTNGRVCNLLSSNGIELDVDGYRCTVNGAEVQLTRAQFAILEVLMRHPNHVLSRQQLMEATYDDYNDNYDRAIDTHIKRLRRQIEPDPANPTFIQTVYGLGYKFVTELPL